MSQLQLLLFNRFPAKHRNLSVILCAYIIFSAFPYRQELQLFMSKFTHTNMKCALEPIDACGLLAMFLMLSLTCAVLCSRHHPRVSGLPADLDGLEPCALL